MPDTSYGSTATKSTAVPVYYGVYSSANTLDLTRGNCLPKVTSISGTYGDVSISFILKNARSDTCSIRPYYSTDGGTTWSECTKGTGGDAKTGLSTSASGTSHTFIHDSYTDLGADYVGDILVKIRAYDRDNYIGDYVDSNIESVEIDNAPSAATLVSPTTGYFQKDDTPEFICAIPTNNNPSGVWSLVHVKLEVDITEDFNSPNLVAFNSSLDQNGWEYKNASSVWTAIPASGIQTASALVGNQVRFVVPTEDRLPRTQIFWRVSFGGVA